MVRLDRLAHCLWCSGARSPCLGKQNVLTLRPPLVVPTQLTVFILCVDPPPPHPPPPPNLTQHPSQAHLPASLARSRCWSRATAPSASTASGGCSSIHRFVLFKARGLHACSVTPHSVIPARARHTQQSSDHAGQRELLVLPSDEFEVKSTERAHVQGLSW